MIYSPKLSEVYRTTFFTIPSTFPGFISTGEVLVADGQGATVWEQITGTTVPTQTVDVSQTTSTNQLFTNYISAGTVILNSANVPQTEANTTSTAIVTARSFSTVTLSTNSLTADILAALEYVGSTIQSSHLSTSQLVGATLQSEQIAADLISSSGMYTTVAQTLSTVAQFISTAQFTALSAQVDTTRASTATFLTVETDSISSGSIAVPNITTRAMIVSSINGQKYPLDTSISPTPQFSTVTIQDTISSISTLTNTVSTGTGIASEATISSLTTSELTALSGDIVFADIGSLSTGILNTSTTSAKYVQTEDFRVKTVSTINIATQGTAIDAPSTNTLTTTILELSTARTAQVYAESVSTASAIFTTLQTNGITTEILSTGFASIHQASISSLELNTLSSGTILAPSSFVSVATVTGQLTANTARLGQISATTVLAPQASTSAAFVSTLNGAPYPVIFSVNPDLQLSTILVRDTMTSQSSFTTMLSTGTLDASLQATSVYTNTISTGTVEAASATFLTTAHDSLSIHVLSNEILRTESTIAYGPTQVSTLLAETASLSTLSTGVLTTEQINIDTTIYTNTLFVNSLSSATLEASTISTQGIVVIQIQGAETNVSSFIGQQLFINTVSTSHILGDTLTTNTLATNTLDAQVFAVTDTAIFDSISTTSISTGTLIASDVYANTLFVSTLSTVTGSMSTTAATAATIEFLSAPTAKYPLDFNMVSLTISTISSAVAEFNFIEVSELVAPSFTFNSATTEIGTIDSISTISSIIGSNYMNEEGSYIYTNTTAASTIRTTLFNLQYALLSSIEANTTTSQEDTHTLTNTNTFKVATLETDSVIINSVLAGSASTNTISTLYSEGGYAQFNTLEANQIQVPSTFANILSTGHLTADTISTHTITVWGPNTLLVQGNTILDGAVEQTGYLFIDSLQTSTIGMNTLMDISSIQLGNAQVSSFTLQDIIGSTLQVSTIDTNATEALVLDSLYLLTSTVNTYQVSTQNFTVEAVYGSTLTLNSFTTVSTISQVDTLIVAELTADYLGITETLSTDILEIKTLDALEVLATNVSTTVLSTTLLEFSSFSLQALQANGVSSGGTSTGSVLFQTVLATAFEATDVHVRTARGAYISTGIYNTESARISTFLTNSLSTGSISTGALEVTDAIFETLSTNRMFLSSVYAQDVSLVSVNTDYISAGTVTIQGNLFVNNLIPSSFEYTTSEFGNSLSAESVSTNQVSTSQVFGGGIFYGQTLSTNIISTLQLTIGTAFISTLFTNSLSIGQLWLSTLGISSVSTTLTETSRFLGQALVRPVTTNADSLSTGTIFGTLLDARVNALSSAAVSTNRVNILSANITSVSSTNIFNSSLLTADQAIFASTFIRQLSVGVITPTSNFIVSSLSTNFISSANISSAVAIVDSLSTLAISTARTTGGAAFIDAISTGFLRAGIITDGELRVSSINGQNSIGYQIPASGGTVTNMTVKEVSQSAALSTTFLSTQYTEVRGPAVIRGLQPFDGWLIGLRSSGTTVNPQWLRYTGSPLTSSWLNASAANVPLTNNTNGIAYNGDHFLAFRNTVGVDTTTSILFSYDGSNWRKIQSGGFYTNAWAGKWNGKMWVAVGTSNPRTDDANPVHNIQHSYDGLNWNNSVTVPSRFMNMRGIDWNGSIWVAGGGLSTTVTSDKKVAWSTDGCNWYRVSTVTGGTVPNNNGGGWGGGSNGVQSILWAKNMWIGVGTATGGRGSAQLQYSLDGSNWSFSQTTYTLDLGQETNNQPVINTVKWSGTRFIAAGSFSSFLTSVDGSNWTSYGTSGTQHTNPVFGLEYDSRYSRWVAVRSNTTAIQRVITSTDDGASWTAIGSSDQTGTPGCVLVTNPVLQSSPDLQLENIEFYTYQQPGLSNRAHQILASTNYFQIDNFAVINPSLNQFIINTTINQQSTAALIVNSTIYCNGAAFKPTGGDWATPSDRRIKQDIQVADYKQCYTTMKNIPMYHYTYTDSYRAATRLRDTSVLGFIAQEVSTYFPNAVTSISAHGFSDLLVLDQDQLLAMHYGATRHLITMNEQHQCEVSSFYTSTLGNMSHYISSIPQTFITLEEEYTQLSTLMATEANSRHAAYESTIASHFITISTLMSKYDILYSMASTLKEKQVATETEQVPSQPPQEEV